MSLQTATCPAPGGSAFSCAHGHRSACTVLSRRSSTQKAHGGSFTCLFAKEQIACSSLFWREGRCCLCIPGLQTKPQLPARSWDSHRAVGLHGWGLSRAQSVAWLGRPSHLS